MGGKIYAKTANIGAEIPKLKIAKYGTGLLNFTP
jgi:hypothetical protein